MRKSLSDMLKIGIVNSIQSFVPVLVWVIMGVVFNDSRYATGYIIVYPYQFVSSLLYHLLFKSQLKREVKYKAEDHDNANTGLLILYTCYSIVFIVSVLFAKQILLLMNLDPINTDIFNFGLIQMILDWIFYGIVTTKQYDDNNEEALKMTLTWYISKLVLIVLCSRIADHNRALALVSVLMCVLLVIYLLKQCSVKHYIFSFKDGIKYSLYDIPSDVAMIFIYVFGISIMAEKSIVVLAAYNIMSMCTDTQWDIIHSAVDTVGTLKVKSGEFIQNTKKLFMASIAYAEIMFVSSLFLIGLCYCIPTYHESINFNMVLIMFIIECAGFPMYTVKYMMNSWTALEHPNVSAIIVTAITYISRFLVTCFVTSIYSVSFGTLTSCILGNTAHILIYLYFRRKDEKVKC